MTVTVTMAMSGEGDFPKGKFVTVSERVLQVDLSRCDDEHLDIVSHPVSRHGCVQWKI